MNKPRRTFDHLYNLQGFDTALFTADIDWAPDFAVAFMLEEFTKIGIPITVFATHNSSLLKGLNSGVEVGLHPDFTRVNGKEDFRSRFESLLTHYPDAQGTRSHRNLFGQNTCELARSLGLSYDLSHSQFQLPWCQAFIDQYGLTRASYCWEDGLHCDFELPLDLSSIDLDSKGLKIFNIHPILFYLNCASDLERRKATSQYADLTSANEQDLKSFVNTQRGIRDLTLELMTYIKSAGASVLTCGEAFAYGKK